MLVDWSFARFFKQLCKYFSSLPKMEFAAVEKMWKWALSAKNRFKDRYAELCQTIWASGCRQPWPNWCSSLSFRRDRWKNVELKFATFRWSRYTLFVCPVVFTYVWFIGGWLKALIVKGNKSGRVFANVIPPVIWFKLMFSKLQNWKKKKLIPLFYTVLNVVLHRRSLRA